MKCLPVDGYAGSCPVDDDLTVFYQSIHGVLNRIVTQVEGLVTTGLQLGLGDKQMPLLSRFAEQNCFQLNDTHPSIAVAELMRLLLDEHDLSWRQAWQPI